MASNNGEPNSAPQMNRWYNIRLGSSFKDPSSTKFCTLRCASVALCMNLYLLLGSWNVGSCLIGSFDRFMVNIKKYIDEFKPASIDKSQAGSLHKSKENRVTVEFHNNQPGKPKVTFEGSSEDCKDNDGVLFFDGETFRLERLHRAVKRLRHVRLPGESAAAANMISAASTGTSVESRSPPLGKITKPQTIGKNIMHSVPVEVERIDIGEPGSPEENLDILGDDDRGTPNKTSAGGLTAAIGFDINVPSNETDDEIADVDVSDEADEGPNAAEALRAQVNAEEEQQQQETSSSSSSTESGSSGSGSGSSSSDSDGSDDDSASSGGDIEI